MIITPTLQDFRNDLHEIWYKEQHYMAQTGDTRSCNLLQTLLSKLDREYGTKYEKTESQFRYDTSAKENIKQGSLFDE